MRHTISVLVENEFGVLARVAGLFSGRGFNIESLSVAETLDPTLSRLTLVTRGDDQVIEQIEKQLNKLVNVIRVTDFTNTQHVERELVLIKVSADERTRGELVNIVDIFRAKIIDESGVVRHFIFINAKFVDNYLFYFSFDLLIGHSFAPLISGTDFSLWPIYF